MTSTSRERERIAVPKSDLAEGGQTTITVRRRELVLFNVAGRVYAVFNRCPHHQAPLSEGRITGSGGPVPVGQFEFDPSKHVVRCPWHHYEYDLQTGRCLADPERYRIATYEVQEEGDELVVYV
jgi:3-phenylpropionate/trans-cinnamate dioxygenase ferredoxin subunit